MPFLFYYCKVGVSRHFLDNGKRDNFAFCFKLDYMLHV